MLARATAKERDASTRSFAVHASGRADLCAGGGRLLRPPVTRGGPCGAEPAPRPRPRPGGVPCAPQSREGDLWVQSQPLAGATAWGTIPQGLPARMAVGLFEDSGQTWMKNSAVKWDARYRYFTKGWVNNWGWGAYDGSWGL